MKYAFLRSAVAAGRAGCNVGPVEKHKAAWIHEAVTHPKAAPLLSYIPARPVRPAGASLCANSTRLSMR